MLADGDAVPPAGAIIVSAARWRRERDALRGRADPVGVVIAAGKEAIEQLREVAEPAAGGAELRQIRRRARLLLCELLRERFGFTGELRAVGDVLLDEIPLMLRCGFNSFEVVNEPTLRALKRGRSAGGFAVLPAEPGAAEVPVGTRPWLRRRAEA